MAAHKAGNVYGGVDRRSISERRRGMDRRNLIRFESLGSDRRNSSYRRQEDVTWYSQRNRDIR